MSTVFLTAEWKKLLMLNYVVDPSLLKKHIPAHTELDLWEDKCYVSLVGFMFQNTRVKGIKIPFHIHFEEVNLRFYVRHFDGKEWKRGVVFIQEIVPRSMISFIANTLYQEHYITLPMQHEWKMQENQLLVSYGWKKNKKWNRISVETKNKKQEIISGSEEEFITEHYWGYTQLDSQKTAEYAVEHPRWEVYETLNFSVEVDFAATYGSEFAFLKNKIPHSVFLAEGSDIIVRKGRKI